MQPQTMLRLIWGNPDVSLAARMAWVLFFFGAGTCARRSGNDFCPLSGVIKAWSGVFFFLFLEGGGGPGR